MLRLVAVVVGALALAGCCIGDCDNGCSGSDCVKGSGKIVSQNRPVTSFTGIRLAIPGRLTIEQTSSDSVTVATDDNLQSAVTSKVENGTLVLACQHCSPTKAEFTVTVKSLQEINLPSAGSAVATKLDGPKLAVRLSGAGSVQLSGQVGDLDVSVSGAGSCNADQLTAKNATVLLSGTGSVHVNATDTLDAKISGVGSIRYRGSPKVTKSVSGIGSIQHE